MPAALKSLRYRYAVLTVAAIAALVLTSVPAASDSSDASQQYALARKAASLITHGDFEEAFKAVQAAPAAETKGPSENYLQRLAGWLADYERLQVQRREKARQAYERAWHRAQAAAALLMIRPWLVAHVGPAAEALHNWQEQISDRTWTYAVVRHALKPLLIAEGYYEYVEGLSWATVLGHLRSAQLHSEDEHTFRGLAFVHFVTEQAEAQAQADMADQKWTEATQIYALLEDLYPLDVRYRQLRKDCQRHVRLELFYGSPDDEEGDGAGSHPAVGGADDEPPWRKALRRVEPAMAMAALEKVDRLYVRKPDFRKLTVSGLEALRMLVITEAVHETFPSLKDDRLRSEFLVRLGEQIRRARLERRMTSSRATQYFQRALRINRETVRLPDEVITAEFIDGALETLDEFSTMIWPEALEEFRKYTMGEFSGVGIQITPHPSGYIGVFSPLEDTPAYEAGIRPGDLITRINGEDTKGMSLDDAVKKITGPPGTRVTLTIRHEGESGERDVTIVRDVIRINTVKGQKRDDSGKGWDYWIDPDLRIAYLRVSSFNESTVSQLQQDLKDLTEQGARGLILDLRWNPGGLLPAAVEMCDLFLPDGKLIVSTAGDQSTPWEERARDEIESYPDLPLVILVNDYSASASEIVSGALKDHGRAIIIGERTYGKGSVQRLIPLLDRSSFLKLTTDYYFLPSGRRLHREEDAAEWGVDPDIRVRLTPEEQRAVLALRREADVVPGKGESADGRPAPAGADEEEDQPDESFRDPQLEAALLVMRARLVLQDLGSSPEVAAAQAERIRAQ